MLVAVNVTKGDAQLPTFCELTVTVGLILVMTVIVIPAEVAVPPQPLVGVTKQRTTSLFVKVALT